MERFEPSTKFVELLVGKPGLPYFNSASLDPEDQCKEGNCGPGEFQDKHGVCHPCRPGTTLDQRFRNHSCRSCFACSEPRSDQIKIQECSATNDTVIGCPPETFQNGPLYDFYCDPCRTCLHGEIEISPCQGGKNTVCGPQTSQAPPVLTTADDTTTTGTTSTDAASTSIDIASTGSKTSLAPPVLPTADDTTTTGTTSTDAASTSSVMASTESKVSTTEGMETGTESTMELNRPTPHYEIKDAQDVENDERAGINLEVETAGNDNKIVIYIVVPVAVIAFLIIVVGILICCRLSKRGTYRLPKCSPSESGGHGTNGPNDGSDIPLQTIATSS